MASLTEEDRLAALSTYGILDTPPEATFDDLTRLASQLCDVPIALVSLVDRDRQWFKSCVGLEVRETPRAIAFCAYALARPEPLVVPDARDDPRFRDNPLVTGPPHIRFYTGFPLVDDTGATLGTLCVIDVRPRVLDQLQMGALRVLADQVVAQLRLRRVSERLRQELSRQGEAARAREGAQAEELAREAGLRAEIELAHRRAAFLADAGMLLAASLDTERTLDAVARLAVPRVADLCSIMVCADDGSLRRVADAGLDARASEEMRRLRERSTSRDAPLAMQHAMAERRPVLFVDYRGWLEARLAPGHPYLATLARLRVTSAISAPMIVSGRMLGVLSAAIVQESGRLYDANDLVTMAELAQRAAVALENARLFAEAQHERARAEKASRTKDDFLAAVSHDLRTPLNAVLGWTEILKKKHRDPALQGRALEVIERSARAQSRLIDDLLDGARIAEGKLHVEIAPVDLVSVVAAALDDLRPVADARGVRVEASLDPEAMDGIGDAGRLQQVVWNLVSNAIKFSRSGGRIDVRLARAGDDALLTVRDEGHGIDADLLPHVFERFRQDDAGAGRRLGGLGLGLAIVKHIVVAVGGSIVARSDGPGHGATFEVHLPLAQAAHARTSAPGVADIGRSTLATVDALAARLEVDAAALRSAHVLVLDEDPETRASLAELLTSYGMRVSVASAADDAFATFRRDRPDLVVAELRATASRSDLLVRVRALGAEEGGRTPALALTATPGAVDRTRALAAGFDFYVPKPVEPAEIVTVLAALRARAVTALTARSRP